MGIIKLNHYFKPYFPLWYYISNGCWHPPEMLIYIKTDNLFICSQTIWRGCCSRVFELCVQTQPAAHPLLLWWRRSFREIFLGVIHTEALLLFLPATTDWIDCRMPACSPVGYKQHQSFSFLPRATTPLPRRFRSLPIIHPALGLRRLMQSNCKTAAVYDVCGWMRQLVSTCCI